VRPALPLGWLVGALVASCASHPPAPPAAPDPPPHAVVEEDAGADWSAAPVVAAAPTKPPSTGSYEDAISVPEPIDVNDERVQLSDGQLTGPMRGVLAGCRVPSNAKVTIKTAVQNGRAIGVTIGVVFDHPKSMKRIPNATVRYEAKLSAKIVTCADKAVRNVTWPPSKRRDSFTTVF
jgi:hypothetical protein